MIIVVEVVLDTTVTLVDPTAGIHRALIRWLCSPQVVAKCLHVEVHTHPVTSVWPAGSWWPLLGLRNTSCPLGPRPPGPWVEACSGRAHREALGLKPRPRLVRPAGEAARAAGVEGGSPAPHLEGAPWARGGPVCLGSSSALVPLRGRTMERLCRLRATGARGSPA